MRLKINYNKGEAIFNLYLRHSFNILQKVGSRIVGITKVLHRLRTDSICLLCYLFSEISRVNQFSFRASPRSVSASRKRE